MSTTRDWLKPGRNEILTMARQWVAVIAEHREQWFIPAETAAALAAEAAAAAAALAVVHNETTRTPVATAACRDAFKTLAVTMRGIKRRYFYAPLLSASDFVSLGLKPPDSTRTPGKAPTAQVTVETFLEGRHELGIKIVYLTGSPDEDANKSYRVWLMVLAPGAVPPASPDDLHRFFFTKSRKDKILFDFSDSGKTVWMAVQVENDGRAGPWGPLVSSLIP